MYIYRQWWRRKSRPVIPQAPATEVAAAVAAAAVAAPAMVAAAEATPVAAAAIADAAIPTTAVAAVAPPHAAEPIRMRQSAAELEAERKGMLESAGLALVETDPQKWRHAYDRAAAIVEAPAHKRVVRARPPVEQGPLILVETRK
jgi:hypothetical protein